MAAMNQAEEVGPFVASPKIVGEGEVKDRSGNIEAVPNCGRGSGSALSVQRYHHQTI
jgi:hypothetical protein